MCRSPCGTPEGGPSYASFSARGLSSICAVSCAISRKDRAVPILAALLPLSRQVLHRRRRVLVRLEWQRQVELVRRVHVPVFARRIERVMRVREGHEGAGNRPLRGVSTNSASIPCRRRLRKSVRVPGTSSVPTVSIVTFAFCSSAAMASPTARAEERSPSQATSAFSASRSAEYPSGTTVTGRP